MAAVDATWMPSWPRLDPTNGARPCLTRMCMRLSSALAMDIQRWSWRYSSWVAVSRRVVVAIRICSASEPGRCRRPLPRSGPCAQMLVVAAMEVGVVGLLGTLLAHALHLAQHPGHQLWLRRDPCFTERVLDDHRPRMFAVHVIDLGPHVRRGKELVDGGVDEHAGRVDAGLVREYVQADAGLGGLHRDSRHALEMAREVAQLLVLEIRDLDAEEIAQLHEHLVHRRVAGALADAVDARREHLRAGAERHHRVPGAQPEVVVKMHDQRRVRRSGFDARNVLADRKRRVAAHGIRRRRTRAPRPDSLAMDLGDVFDVGAAAVLAAELDRGRALLTCIADRVAHHPQVGGAVEPNWQLEPLGFGNAFAMQQGLPELVLHVQVGS